MLGGKMSNERNSDACISFTVDKSGEFYIDVNIEDYSEETISRLALLFASIGSDSFDNQTMEILRAAFLQENKEKAFSEFLTQALLKKAILQGKTINKKKDKSEERNKDQPIIKPTDML
tara:strand:+ start:71 stop:427 length:357 start_codon:yes stop_codon:yes gene_type:complete